MPKNYESYADNEPGKKLAVMVVMSGGGAYFNTNATTDVNNKTANNSGEDSTFAMARSTGLNYLADEMGIILIYFRQSNSTINQGWYWNHCDHLRLQQAERYGYRLCCSKGKCGKL